MAPPEINLDLNWSPSSGGGNDSGGGSSSSDSGNGGDDVITEETDDGLDAILSHVGGYNPVTNAAENPTSSQSKGFDPTEALEDLPEEQQDRLSGSDDAQPFNDDGDLKIDGNTQTDIVEAIVDNNIEAGEDPEAGITTTSDSGGSSSSTSASDVAEKAKDKVTDAVNEVADAAKEAANQSADQGAGTYDNGSAQDELSSPEDMSTYQGIPRTQYSYSGSNREAFQAWKRGDITTQVFQRRTAMGNGTASLVAPSSSSEGGDATQWTGTGGGIAGISTETLVLLVGVIAVVAVLVALIR